MEGFEEPMNKRYWDIFEGKREIKIKSLSSFCVHLKNFPIIKRKKEEIIKGSEKTTLSERENHREPMKTHMEIFVWEERGPF